MAMEEEIINNGRLPWLAGVASAMVAAALTSVLVYAIISRNNQENNCRAALNVRDGVVVLLEDARNLVANPPRELRPASKEEREVAVLFYDRNLRKLRNVNCDT